MSTKTTADENLLEEFPPVSTKQWEQAIQKDLKGADYAKKLLWKTEDGLTIRPYYRREDLGGITFLDAAAGEFPYVRGNRASGGWKIREEIEARNPEEANRLAREALALWFGRFRSSSIITVDAVGWRILHFGCGMRSKPSMT